jgi:hypothetical protein
MKQGTTEAISNMTVIEIRLMEEGGGMYDLQLGVQNL